jgi:sodium/potassium-transporting ATPase subunit alpha
MKINSLSHDEALLSLGSSEGGLPEDEARRRLSEFGLNEIREVRKRPLIFGLLDQFTHFFAVLLWIAALMSFLSECLHPGEGMLTLGIAIVAVIFINAVFTFIQEYRAEKAVGALRKLLPFRVKVVRDGKEKEIYAREVVPGDIILLAEGDRIPADARLWEACGLKVNNAPLTGESAPVTRSHGECTGEFIESTNIVFAGTTVVSGSGKAVVYATGMTTEFGRIAHLTSAVEPGSSPLQKEIVKTTRIIAAIAAAIGIFFFLMGFVIGRDFWDNFIFAIGITVALIPEGLLPTVTLALAMGSQRMAGRNAIIKTLTSVETLGCVTVICTDKTGTLTQNRMSVRKTWFGELVADAGRLGGEDASELLRVAYYCNNARLRNGEYCGDPTEVALFKTARERIGDRGGERLFEIPFDPERKRMSTVNDIGGRTFVFTKGAPESLLPQCSRFLLGGTTVPLDDRFREKTAEAYHAMMDMGLRVLSFAYREMEPGQSPDAVRALNDAGAGVIEKDMVFAGLIGLEDPPRPEVADAIGRCEEAGIRVIMITGDGSRTAVAIAREIGLVKGEPAVVEGYEFNRMGDNALREKLGEKEVIFARMTPKHKMRVVSLLKEEGEIVAVTGDGVNDAPALRKADIGIAMGLAGTDVAKEASDMVLLDDNFATLVDAVEEGRGVFENIKKFITYIFSSNIPEAVPYLSYILLRIPLPLTIIQILAVDLGTDMLPALALGAERPTPGVMKQPPRSPKERLLSVPLLLTAYLFLGPIEAAACMFGFLWVLFQGGWKWNVMLPSNDALYMQATTACLTAIIVTQIANVFACRSSRESVFTLGLFSNRLIFAGIAFELLLQVFIVYHPWGNEIFATRPISLSVWAVLVPFAVILFSAEELRKVVVNRTKKSDKPSIL